MAKVERTVTVQSPLKWPHGWDRTPLRDRKDKNSWKRSQRDYVEQLETELKKMKFTEALLTFNDENQRLDPGVAVYFAQPRVEDFSWQTILGIDSPAPTVEQIDTAFKHKVFKEKNHPDLGGDLAQYQKLDRARKEAKAWILGESRKDYEFCIPCDLFKEVRLNIAGVCRILAHMRGLEEFGNPGLLERSFRGFKVALPARASEVMEDVRSTA